MPPPPKNPISVTKPSRFSENRGNVPFGTIVGKRFLRILNKIVQKHSTNESRTCGHRFSL